MMTITFRNGTKPTKKKTGMKKADGSKGNKPKKENKNAKSVKISKGNKLKEEKKKQLDNTYPFELGALISTSCMSLCK